MRRIEFVTGHDGTAIACSSEGRGAVIVLCDGIGCDHYVWRKLRPNLVERFRVITWNYRGHGHSDMPVDPAAVTIRDHAQDLVRVLDHFGVKQAILAGHSMGVQVIYEFYALASERVRALIPICGASGHPLDTFGGDGRLKDRIYPFLFRLLTSENPQFVQVWRTLFPTSFAWRLACLLEINGSLVSRQDFEPYLEHMGRMDLGLFARTLQAASVHTAEPLLDQIRVPTLIFAGERDGFTPVEVSYEMQRRIPGAELCVIPGGSHTAPIEVPELVQLRLDKFLRDHALEKARKGRRRQKA
jgi:pimeloyl-ACP methyl ester carboxylesterase